MRGSGRIASAMTIPTTHMAAAASQGTTRVSSSRSLPANSGRNTSGPSAAPNSAPKRTYEIARAFFCARVHVGNGGPRQEHRAVHPAHAEKAEDHERGRVRNAAESREHAPDHTDDEAAGDHGDAAEAIHEPARGQCGERAGGDEDRRPEPEDRLDPGDEHERDRRHSDRELKHAGKGHEAEREQDGVPPDGVRRRPATAAIQPTQASNEPRSCSPLLCAERNGELGQPG